MTYTAPAGDVIIQEGTFMYNFTASGTIVKGGPVCAAAGKKVKAATRSTAASCIGVAAYPATDGKKVGVYGPGNIVEATVSGASVAAGDILMPTNYGWCDSDGYPSGHAIALETQGTTTGECQILLI